MSITVRFACGHEATVGLHTDSAPTCGCGETRIARVRSRGPRFVGACSGPYADTKALDPGVVDLTTAGSLQLKERV